MRLGIVACINIGQIIKIKYPLLFKVNLISTLTTSGAFALVELNNLI